MEYIRYPHFIDGKTEALGNCPQVVSVKVKQVFFT